MKRLIQFGSYIFDPEHVVAIKQTQPNRVDVTYASGNTGWVTQEGLTATSFANLVLNTVNLRNQLLSPDRLERIRQDKPRKIKTVRRRYV